ncbi:MAG: hypothetical protein NTV51_28175, partial [Verrucomicrobia bacterium]|nr:hypothetical protein [Verrucomicrobiota bacterium]
MKHFSPIALSLSRLFRLAPAVFLPAFAATLALAAPELARDFPSPAPAASHCANLTAAPDGTLHLTYYAPAPSSDLASPPPDL